MNVPPQKKILRYPSGKSSLRRRKRFNLAKSKLPVVFLIFLLVYAIFSVGVRFNNLYAMQQDLRKIQEQVNKLERKNAELRKQLEMVMSDAYVEEVAREKLGLVKEGETRIVLVEKPSKKEVDSSIRD